MDERMSGMSDWIDELIAVGERMKCDCWKYENQVCDKCCGQYSLDEIEKAMEAGRELLGQIREPIFAFNSKKYPSSEEINAYWLSRMDDLTARLEAEQSPEEGLQAVKDQVKDWTKEQRQALYTHLYEVYDCRIYQK